MTSIRSSVRPKSSKQPWGTILKPDFGMGHQKMNEYEIEQTVERLTEVKPKKEPEYVRPKCAKLDKDGVEAMLERLAKVDNNKVTDSNRTQSHSIYRDMGVTNAFAWKGYN